MRAREADDAEICALGRGSERLAGRPGELIWTPCEPILATFGSHVVAP
jgi:hypothetical protein